jgi:adenine-specific DNA-methyltransferase
VKTEMTMNKLTQNDPETRSPDGVAENIRRLKALFPELVTEGPNGAAVNVDVLKALVGDATVTDADEKYGLNWHGKRRARQLALTPSTGTLRPCPEDSVDWDTTQNLMIEGDNLEVLKLLQKSYAGKVKLIYIDPPYNTGNEFIYPDKYEDNLVTYLRYTGQIDDEGFKVSSNSESSGRYHTNWLQMMYPRLKLARDLLRDDGAIFVSIDDHEVHNLRALLDEVFGQENFVATVIWHKVYAPKNTSRHFSEDHDYIVVYARNADAWTPQLLERTQDQDTLYKNPDGDPRGPWMSDNLTARNYYSAGTYTITGPTGKTFTPGKGKYWRLSFEKFKELDADGRIWWGADKSNMPRLKRFLSEVSTGRVPQTLWRYSEVGHTQDAKRELLEFVDFEHTDNVLNSVKPSALLCRILDVATNPESDDLVLDFFAGSGVTGHAVYKKNAESGGKRRFILVQLPEPLPRPEQNVRTIADLAKSRLQRSGKALRESAGTRSQDFGFRVFKLDSSNIRAWEPDRDNLDQTLLDSMEHIKPDRTESDVLYELLLKLGLDLCVPIETRTFAGKEVHSVGGGVLMACLAPKIERTEVEVLAQGIVDWHKALAPAGDTTCVFRDSAFADDVAKTNMAAILEQHGITNVRSL